MTWITRGQKPDRILEAGAVGLLEGLVKGLVQGDGNPLWRAGLTALGSAVANNPHRLTQRLTAKKRIDTLLDEGFEAAKRMPTCVGTVMPSTRQIQPGSTAAFSKTVSRIRAVQTSGGSTSVMVFVPTSLWRAMSEREQTTLRNAPGVQLRTLSSIEALVVLPLPQ